MFINFGKETRDKLIDCGYTTEDINWIGCEDFQVPINNFFFKADSFNYDNGYGHASIPLDLIICMKDGSWFTRYEYDGSEWWKYNVAPKKPEKVVKLTYFFDTYYSKLSLFTNRTNDERGYYGA